MLDRLQQEKKKEVFVKKKKKSSTNGIEKIFLRESRNRISEISRKKLDPIPEGLHAYDIFYIERHFYTSAELLFVLDIR